MSPHSPHLVARLALPGLILSGLAPFASADHNAHTHPHFHPGLGEHTHYHDHDLPHDHTGLDLSGDGDDSGTDATDTDTDMDTGTDTGTDTDSGTTDTGGTEGTDNGGGSSPFDNGGIAVGEWLIAGAPTIEEWDTMSYTHKVGSSINENLVFLGSGWYWGAGGTYFYVAEPYIYNNTAQLWYYATFDSTGTYLFAFGPDVWDWWSRDGSQYEGGL